MLVKTQTSVSALVFMLIKTNVDTPFPKWQVVPPPPPPPR